MKLTFLGTSGEIRQRTRRHRRHTTTLVAYRGRRILLDWGADWLGQLGQIRPDAVVLTHAHADHAGGLAEGTACPVYASRETWERIARYPIANRRLLAAERPTAIHGISFEACPVEHSVRAPAVGYRITAGRARIFYAPDLLEIRRRSHALHGIRIYIGDGASVTRPIVRRHGSTLTGHASIATQLAWCRDAGIRRAIFTHCGTQIVSAPTRDVERRLQAMGREAGVRVGVAYDGMQVVMP